MANVRYFDSSVVLSMLFNEGGAEQALALWQEASLRVTSRLLLIECSVVIARFALRLPEDIRNRWSKESYAWLRTMSESLYLYEVSATIETRISGNLLFGKIRSLDAIHLATAQLIQEKSDDFKLVTFDLEMDALAKSFAIQTVGRVLQSKQGEK